MTRLLLVDTRVTDITKISDSLTSDTEIISFDYSVDTLESLKEKIGKSYETVCIAQHNYTQPAFQLLESMQPARLAVVEVTDTALSTWSELIDLFVWMKNERGVQYVDLLACFLWENPEWRYVIETIRSVHQVYIRASVNITGESGDFILESDNVDLIGLYFTNEILSYKYDFYYAPTTSGANHTSWNPPATLPGNGGTISVSKYTTLLGTMLQYNGNYTNPPGATDMTNIVSFTANAVFQVPNAYGALTASGQAIFFGKNVNGGDSSSVASSISSGVKKIIPSAQGFAILRTDGGIASWGYSQYYPITQTGVPSIKPPSAISLTGYTDVVASGNTFCGLKSDGTVVMWGYVGTWTLPTSTQLSNVIQIKELYGYPSYSFIALRSNGHAVIWGPAGVADTTGLASTSPIVGIYGTDYLAVIVRADGTIYNGFTNAISYTMPAGVSVVNVISAASSSNFMVLLSNNTMYTSGGTGVVSKVADITVNDSNCVGYISNGAVVTSGDVRFGGSTTNATNGIKSGISVSSGVIRLASSSGSMAALKADGTVAVWGANYGGWPAAAGVQSQLTNVVQLTAVYAGYIAITSDNRIINWGDNSNKWNGSSVTPSVNNTTFSAGNTIAIYNAFTTPVLVEMPISIQITPTSIPQYTTSSITYTTNVQYKFAIAGHKYGLYNGTTLLSTFQSFVDTPTYVFGNIGIPTSGAITASIKDITDVVYIIDSSVNFTVTPNSVIPAPNPPSIVSVTAGNQKINVVVSPASFLAGGVPVLSYQYSLDGGSNFITLPSQNIVTGVSLNTLSTIISSGGTANMLRMSVNTSGTVAYVTDIVANKVYRSTYNGTAWSALSNFAPSFTLPANPYGFDMNGDCTRGVCVSVNGSSKCFYFTNAFNVLTQIQDNVARTYTALCMSSDGNTIAAIADKLYYATWNDASQNFGVFSVANTDTVTGGYGVALSSDGKIIAYVNGTSISYANWNGSGFSAGTVLSTLSTVVPYGLRFSNDGSILFAGCGTSCIYASYFDGSVYTPFTLFSAPITNNTYNVWGISVDASNNLYATAYLSSSIFALSTNVATTSTNTPNKFSIQSGLTMGNSYTLQLKSTSAGGNSAVVVASSAVVPYAPPNPPTINTVTAGNAQITFTYTAGASNGSTITNYYYSINGSTYVSMGSTSGSYTISTGLTNGTAYYVSMKASNQAGISTSVTSASSVTPATVPGTPTITSTTAGTGQITVNFNAPASNGGSAITGYNYTTDGTNYTFTSSTTSPLIITGLNNGVTYTVKLQSVNALGNSAATAGNSVVMPNTVPAAPEIVSVTPGNAKVTVQFTAPANGGSPISYYYYSDNSGAYISTGSTSTSFVVSGLTNGTSHRYKLIARNSVGNSVASAESVVVVPYTVPNQPVISTVTPYDSRITVVMGSFSNGGSAITSYSYSLNGTAFVSTGTANATFDVSGLTNGTSYSIVVVAVNAAGSSANSASWPSVTPGTVPSQPVISSVTPSSGSATVQLGTAAAYVGTAITGYSYTYTTGGTTQTGSVTTNNTFFTVTGLTNGSAYTFTVAALNTFGLSTYSASSTSVTPGTVPSQPVINSLISGNGQITLEFTAPSSGSSDITNYYYKYNTGSYVSTGNATVPIVVTGLTNGTSYTFQLIAQNATGNSTASPVSVAATPCTIPSSPTVGDISVGNGQLTVAYTAPTDNGGSAVTNYYYSSNNGESYTYVNNSTNPFTITGLVNGTAYSVKMIATNVAGNSAPSAASAYYTPITTPSAPTISSAVVGNQQITIYFALPYNGGSVITDMQYKINDGSFVSMGASVTSYAIDSLVNGTAYSIAIRAVNAAGNSDNSVSVSATPYTVPDAPTITASSAGNQQLSVTFSAPAWNGGTAITGYKYSLDGGSTVVDCTSPSFTVYTLTNGQSYTVSVYALNPAGSSVASNSVSLTPFTVPDAPTIASWTPANQSAVLTFSAPQSNGGSAITSYKYSLNGASYESITVDSSPLTIAGLTNGTAYSLSLVAVNAAGVSTPTSTGSSAIPFTVPDQPVITSIVSGNTILTVNYTSYNQGRAINDVFYSIDNGVTFVDASNGGANPLVIPGLTNGTSYDVVIQTVNEAGNSVASTSVAAIPYTVPDAPLLGSLENHSQECYVSFLEGVSNGGNAVVSYSYVFTENSTLNTILSGSLASISTLHFSGLVAYNTYTLTLTSVNAAGSSLPLVIHITGMDVPNAPTIQYIAAGYDSAQIYYTDGSDNASSVIHHQYSVNGGAFVDISNGSPLAVPGLQPDVASTIAIRSVNSIGVSATSNTLPVTPYTLPEPPTITNVSPGNQSVKVSFTPGFNHSSSIITYKYSLNEGVLVDASTTLSPFYIRGLTNGASYTVRLVETNAAGDSSYSTVSPTFIPYVTPPVPGAPTIDNVVPGVSSALIYFTNGVNIGPEILGYKYKFAVDGEAYYASGTTSPILIANLDNGTPYQFQLVAFNAGGDSNPSDLTTTPVVPFDIPSAPAIVDVATGDSSIQIYFLDGNLNGKPFVNYWVSMDGGSTYQVATDVCNNVITVHDLNNGIAYSISMKTQTTVGTSSASNLYSGIVPSTVPDAPTITSVMEQNKSALVYFDLNDNHGSEVTHIAYALDGSSVYQWAVSATSPMAINGLVNGESHTVTLKSYSVRGFSQVSNQSDTFSAFDLPNPPVIQSVTVSDQTLTVTFADGNTNGRPITSYMYALNGGSYVSAPDLSNPLVISGLTNGVPTNVTMMAVTNAGYSTPSNTTDYYIPTSRANAPIIVSATAGDKQITVDISNGDLKGLSANAYKYSLNGVTPTVWFTQTVAPYVITGLQNGTPYTVQVSVVTNFGESSLSDASDPVAPFAIQGAPVITRVAEGISSATIHFIDGNANGTTLQGYQYSLDGGINFNDGLVQASNLQIVIPDLINGNAYTVCMRSVSNKGNSSLSNESDTFVPYTAPNTPVITGVTPYNESIQVAFTQGSLGGSELVGYKYKRSDVVGEFWASESPFTIGGLTNGVSYTVQLKTVTKLSESTYSEVSPAAIPYVLVPDAPHITSVVPANGSVTVNFTPGNTNGALVYNYQYTIDGTTFYVANLTTANSFKISDLSNNVSYQVSIKTFSNYGFSLKSSQSSSFVPFTVPEAPTVGTVTAGNQSAVIHVTDGSNNGRSIEGYYYSLNSLNGNTPYKLCTQSSSPLTITDLSNNVQYVVSVKAYNAGGLSSASNVSTIFMPFTQPDAPTITSVIDGSGCATVNVVSGNLNGSAIIGYSYSLDGIQWTDVSTTANSFIVTDLVNGNDYNVYVKTISTAGYSGVSPASESFVPSTVPTSPVITNVVAGDSRLNVFFTQGSNNGAEITSYIYAVSRGSGYTSYYTAIGTSSPITIYNLTNATPYTIRLCAVNVSGPSAYAEWLTPATPYTLPSAPVITQCYPRHNSALVYFSNINTYGSPLVKFQYSLGGDFMDVSGITSPLTIPGLQNKSTYNISIMAYNAAGASRPSNIKQVIPGTPQAPLITNVVAAAKSLIVYFDQVAAVDPVLSFYYNTVGSSSGFQKISAITSPVTIPKLVNGTPYTIQLQSYNKTGLSQISNSFGPVSPCEPPSMLSFTVTPGVGKAIINLLKVTTNGNPILKYKYTLSIDSPTVFYDVSGITNPLTIYNLPNNTPIRVTMYAVNSAGMSPASLPSAPFTCVFLPPPAVAALTLTAGLNKVTFSFKAPVPNPNTPILTYLYILNDNVSGSSQYINANTTSTTFVISGLSNNVNYTARVIAVNAAGMSPPSPIMTKTVRYDYDVPTAPTIISITASNESAVVKFNPPTKFNNSPLVKYKYALDGSTTLVDISSLATTGTTTGGITATIAGIPNNVSHTIQLAAVNGVGTSALSVASKPFMYIYTAPGAPTIGTITTVTGGSATMMVTNLSANGSPITNYAYSLNGTDYTTVGTTMPVQISGLTPNVQYTVRVVAINAVGTSPTATKTFLAK